MNGPYCLTSYTGKRCRYLLRAAGLMITLSSCVTEQNLVNEDGPVSQTLVLGQTADEPATRLYRDAEAALGAGDHDSAIKLFREIEDNYPYLDIAKYGQLGVAYAFFSRGSYQESIQELDRFIAFHPVDKNIDYAYYLKASNYYMQIPGSGRDMRLGQLAFGAFDLFLRRFPHSRYANDASAKMREVEGMLATNHMAIGRFYQNRQELLAAINRFQLVVRVYSNTTQTPEALHRLVECFIALGVTDEALQTAQLIALNFPASEWANETQTLLASTGLWPEQTYDLAQVPHVGSDANAADMEDTKEDRAEMLALRSDKPGLVTSAAPKPTVESADKTPVDVSHDASPGFRFGGSTYNATSAELALLQRWNLSRETKQSDTDLSFENKDGSVNYSLAFEGDTKVTRPGPSLRPNTSNEWDQSFAVRGELSWSGLATIQFENQLIEQRDQDEFYIGSFLIPHDSNQWEQNRINSSALTIGLLDDRLKSSTVLNTSRYTDWGMDGAFDQGSQILHRMDLDVWRGDETRLSVFGAYGMADKDYNDSIDDDLRKDSKSNKVEDTFAGAGYGGLKFGGTFGIGPVSLGLTQIDTWDAEDSDGIQQTTYQTKLGLDLSRLRGYVGELFGDTFWNIAPDYVFTSYGITNVDLGSEASAEDLITDVSAGANWDWGNGYSYLSYWYSYYDSQQSGDYDWVGDGLDLGGGIWGDKWDFNGWLYLSRSEQMGEWSEFTDLSVGGGLSMGYQPDEFPNVRFSIESDHYQADYIAFGGAAASGSWVFTTELDFTKYWVEFFNPRPSNLGLVFQVRNDSSQEKWDDTVSRISETNYFIGLMMGISLGEPLQMRPPD